MSSENRESTKRKERIRKEYHALLIFLNLEKRSNVREEKTAIPQTQLNLIRGSITM